MTFAPIHLSSYTFVLLMLLMVLLYCCDVYVVLLMRTPVVVTVSAVIVVAVAGNVSQVGIYDAHARYNLLLLCIYIITIDDSTIISIII